MAITKRQMTMEDWLEIMAENGSVYPEYALLSDTEKRAWGTLNLAAGFAEAYLEDGKLIGVGGIRYCGIGEAWMISRVATRQDIQKPSFFRFVKKNWKETTDEHNLFRVFAESKISVNFLEHIGFVKNPKGLVWTRQ